MEEKKKLNPAKTRPDLSDGKTGKSGGGTRKPSSKNQQRQIPQKDQKRKFNPYWIYGIIIVFLISTYFFNSKSDIKETTWNEFESNMLLQGDIDKLLVVNGETVEVFIKIDKLSKEKYKDVSSGFRGINKGPHYYFTIGSLEAFEKRLEEAQNQLGQKINVSYEKRRNWGGEILSWVIPIAILVIIWIIIMQRVAGGAGGPGGIFNIGKSRAMLFDKDSDVKINFNDVAGLEEAKMEVKEIVDFLKNPKKYTQLGAKIPKGALLVGPPGTGKTLMAKAMAGEAQVPFFSISGSDFVEMFVGVGASRVRDLFRQAKEKAPCIIFIDEIDAVGRTRARGIVHGANDERENTLNQLLSEMDGFQSNAGIIILAATNRVDVIDRALLRPGRFDRQIFIDLPDMIERKEIFKVHMKPLKVDETINIEFLARQTPGFSGADIANVCNEAALIAARNEKKKIEKQDFLDAIDRIIAGLEKKNKIITNEEKKVIAYHEAGHATLSWFLEYASPLVKVSIIPRGKSLGAAWYLPEERQITTTEQLADELSTLMGGRASEEINFGKISTGALSDIERATKIAYSMVAIFGMSKEIGNISYYDSTGHIDFLFTKPYSEKTAQIIDGEVKKFVENAYQRAKNILSAKKDGLIKLSELLLEKEVIFSDDLEAVFGKRPWESKEKAENEQKEQKENKIKEEFPEENTQPSVENVSNDTTAEITTNDTKQKTGKMKRIIKNQKKEKESEHSTSADLSDKSDTDNNELNFKEDIIKNKIKDDA